MRYPLRHPRRLAVRWLGPLAGCFLASGASAATIVEYAVPTALRFGKLSEASAFVTYEDPDVQGAVKVLDGCGVNGQVWAFVSGLTDQEVYLHVDDTMTGETQRADGERAWSSRGSGPPTFLGELNTLS